MDPRDLEEVSTCLVTLGLVFTIICCILLFWRGTKVSEDIIIWEGLWEFCETQGLEILQCGEYSPNTLPQDIRVSRVLGVTCIVITCMGLMDIFCGVRIRVLNTSTEDKMMVARSVLFLGLGVCVLGNTQCYPWQLSLSLLLSAWKPEMGVSLYLGWLSSLLLLLGGAFLGGAHLWCKTPTNNDQPSLQKGSNNDQPSPSEGSRDRPSSENNA